MPIAPCKNCEKKGCGSYHSECLEYQKFIKENEEIKKKAYEEKKLYRREYKR